MSLLPWLGLAGVGLGALAAAGYARLAHRGYRWLGPYLRQARRRRPPDPNREHHVFLCICDHYEPKAGRATREHGMARVAHWVHEYPRQFSGFRDADGRPPRYSFFFPAEEYEPEYLDALAGLCRQGFGEVELHLHHKNDTPDNLRFTLAQFRDTLVTRHGLLSRDKRTGRTVYSFIHGNWALCNSKPDGAWCGVNNEIPILRETGCYADFTFPSFPDPTQPPIVNRMYYAWDRPGRPRSHFRGRDLGAMPPPDDALLLIPGPLVLDWRSRKWGLVPRIENACLQESQPPTLSRLDNWLRASIRVPNRPDWYFVKLHAHGAPEVDRDTLLGEPMVRFHEALADRARQNPRFRYHYVTAREFYNLAKAAEAGYTGDADGARDFLIASNLTAAHLDTMAAS